MLKIRNNFKLVIGKINIHKQNLSSIILIKQLEMMS